MNEVRSIEIPEKGRFQADRVPSRTTWPPPWLVEAETAKPECKAADTAVETTLAVANRVELPLADPLPLSRVLPPLSWLTHKQRHRFEHRASVYQFDAGMSRDAAEQEAMSELIFRGGVGNQLF